MLSHRANVASIVSRRAELAGLGDLIEPPMMHQTLPGTRILPDLSDARKVPAVRLCVPDGVADADGAQGASGQPRDA
jgi:hypothetical protein